MNPFPLAPLASPMITLGSTVISSGPAISRTPTFEFSTPLRSSERDLRAAWETSLRFFQDLSGKFRRATTELHFAAINWLSPRNSGHIDTPLLISAAMATAISLADFLEDDFAKPESGTGVHLRLDGMGPEGSGNDNESVRNAAEILTEDLHRGQCRRLCGELGWLAPDEMSQVLRLATEKEAPEKVISRLSLIADEANSDHEYLMLLELTIGGLTIPSFSGCGLQAILEKLGRKAPDHERREAVWTQWVESLNNALNNWSERDPSGTTHIDGLLAAIRSSAWRTGYPSPTIDRLISLSPVIDIRQNKIGRYYLYAAGCVIRQRSAERDMVRRFLEIQYVTDRIAACGDLARAKVILSDSIEEFRKIEKGNPSVRASYFRGRLQSLHDGVITVLNFTAILSASSLSDAISLYRSPDYLQVPPVHIVIRGLRRNAAILAAKGKSKETIPADIHATVRELAQIRIIDPILNDHLADSEIKNIHDRLLDALGAGEAVGQQEWANLLTESVDLLNRRNLLFQAHDLMRALQKVGVCDSRFFSSLCMTMVTNVEILLHKANDPALRARLSELRDRLVEWQETCDA